MATNHADQEMRTLTTLPKAGQSKRRKSFIVDLVAEMASVASGRVTNNHDYLAGPECTSVRFSDKFTRPLFAAFRALISAFIQQRSLQRLYTMLGDEQSKQLLVKLFAFRVWGARRVKLPTNNPEFWSATEKVEELCRREANELKEPVAGNQPYLFDLRAIGYPISARTIPLAVRESFLLKQYECLSTESIGSIAVKENNVVLDMGGCYGDTALYFAYLAGPSGKVFSFEFVPSNVHIFENNLRINPELAKRITLVRKAVHRTSGSTLNFRDHGPSSKLGPDGASGTGTSSATTISVDDFVRDRQLSKVDYIKMDIEGSEMSALQGAVRTIERFKPQMAIAVYHKHDDISRVFEYLRGISGEYKFYLRHFSVSRLETVLFATHS